MKDLKENIKKHNMKKLVLSAVLGMFCYCTNNAMKKPIEIDDVNFTILSSQVRIYNAGVDINKYKEKIYFAIEEGGKITKKKVLQFIINLYTTDEQKEKGFGDKINTIEQYFHLDLKKDDDECKNEDLTETFWTVPKTEDEKQEVITVEEKKPIKEYFNTIIKAENNLSRVFKSYYNEKKTKKDETTDEDILKEIMKDLCGEKEGDKVSIFIEKLRKVCTNNVENNGTICILETIKKRITLSDNIQKQAEDFISFLKQKIGIEEKKEEEKINPKPKVEEEGGCPCCDCWGKKKNQVENESSKEKPVKIYNNP